MDKFDVIVVGAGPAGSAAAYIAAQGGASVLLIERGPYPGSKNVSGALVYRKVVENIFPLFWEQAPVERAIQGHQLVFLGEQSAVGIDNRQYPSDADHIPNAYSVHRAKFDAWLAAQAEQAGAMLVPGFTVDQLLMEDDRVVGIQAGPDQIFADVVIDAEGAKSLLLENAGLRQPYDPAHIALGIKQVIQLPADTIEARFNLLPGEGTALTLVGGTDGLAAGGFLYTNIDTISLGLVVRLPDLGNGEQHPHELLEQYRQHPYIQSWIEGGEILEYSAATVHEGSLQAVPPLYRSGLMVVGSAAGLLVNNLFTFRGIDLAIESGALAAKAYLEAREKGDFSASGLALYAQMLEESFVLQDMRTFHKAYQLVENPRFVSAYPELICEALESFYSVNAVPSSSLRKNVIRQVSQKIGFGTLVKDLWSMGRSL